MDRKKILMSAFAVLMCSAIAVFGSDKADLEVTADYNGKYIWRGQNLNDDPVFQPGFSISYGNLTTGIWGNMDLANINGNSGDFSEVDYSLDYSATLPGIEGVGYCVGVLYYDFPGTLTKDTTEVYLGFNFAVPLNPSITVYHDIDEAEGSYVSLAVSKSIERICELSNELPVGLDIGASLGWASGSYNKYYWGVDQSKLNDLAFSVSFPMEIAGWTMAPSLNYVTLLSDDIRDTDTYGTESDFFFAGVSVSKSF